MPACLADASQECAEQNIGLAFEWRFLKNEYLEWPPPWLSKRAPALRLRPEVYLGGARFRIVNLWCIQNHLCASGNASSSSSDIFPVAMAFSRKLVKVIGSAASSTIGNQFNRNRFLNRTHSLEDQVNHRCVAHRFPPRLLLHKKSISTAICAIILISGCHHSLRLTKKR